MIYRLPFVHVIVERTVAIGEVTLYNRLVIPEIQDFRRIRPVAEDKRHGLRRSIIRPCTRRRAVNKVVFTAICSVVEEYDIISVRQITIHITITPLVRIRIDISLLEHHYAVMHAVHKFGGIESACCLLRTYHLVHLGKLLRYTLLLDFLILLSSSVYAFIFPHILLPAHTIERDYIAIIRCLHDYFLRIVERMSIRETTFDNGYIILIIQHFRKVCTVAHNKFDFKCGRIIRPFTHIISGNRPSIEFPPSQTCIVIVEQNRENATESYHIGQIGSIVDPFVICRIHINLCKRHYPAEHRVKKGLGIDPAFGLLRQDKIVKFNHFVFHTFPLGHDILAARLKTESSNYNYNEYPFHNAEF